MNDNYGGRDDIDEESSISSDYRITTTIITIINHSISIGNNNSFR